MRFRSFSSVLVSGYSGVGWMRGGSGNRGRVERRGGGDRGSCLGNYYIVVCTQVGLAYGVLLI